MNVLVEGMKMPKNCLSCPLQGDRIRNMTDEELAKFLQEDVFYEPWCSDDVVCLFGDGCQLADKDCGKCALKWIKQEYKNGQIHKA